LSILRNHEIPKTCDRVKWGYYPGGNALLAPEHGYGYGEVFTLSQGYRIGYNVQGGDNPTIGGNDKFRAAVNLDYRGAEVSTRLDLRQWLRRFWQ